MLLSIFLFSIIYLLGYYEAYKTIKIYAITYNRIEQIKPLWARIDRNWAFVYAIGSWLSFMVFAQQLIKILLNQEKIQDN